MLGQGCNPVDGGLEAVHDGVFDASDLFHDDIPNALEDTGEEVDDRSPDGGDGVPCTAEDGNEHFPRRRSHVLDGVPGPFPVASEDVRQEVDEGR